MAESKSAESSSDSLFVMAMLVFLGGGMANRRRPGAAVAGRAALPRINFFDRRRREWRPSKMASGSSGARSKRGVRATATLEDIRSQRNLGSDTECPHRLECQEQIQIIATAIGKPMAKVAAIVDANANRRFCSCRTLSNSGMVAYSANRKAKGPLPGRSYKTASLAHAHCVSSPRRTGALRWLTKY